MISLGILLWAWVAIAAALCATGGFRLAPHRAVAWRRPRRSAAAAGCLLAAALLDPATGRAQLAPEIREWPVPWPSSRPRDPSVAPDGSVWFVGQQADYLARLHPESGRFERFGLDPGAGPHNLIVGADGAVWFAANRAGYIGRLDPATGEIRKYPMEDPAARDPHTLVFDSRGDIWFTVQHGNFVGKLEVTSGRVRLLPLPTPTSRPYGIVVDPDDRPWFTEFAGGKIGTVDPETFALREFELPRPETRPRRLVVTPAGTVWYVDFAGGRLGALDPATGSTREWMAPGGADARPYGMTVDDRGRIWFVETGPDPNRLVGFDPAIEEFFAIRPIPSGGGSVRHMTFYTPRGEIWFGTDANTIGRAVVGTRGAKGGMPAE